jgi:hypothetical protein
LIPLRVAIASGSILGMVLSYHLWLSARTYPLTPVLPFLKVPGPIGAILFGATLLALAGCAITPRPIPVFAVLAAVLALCDQSRLQPWFYQYTFLLLGVAFAAPNACRLIVATVYFWSGIQKINPGFVNDVFPWMLEPFIKNQSVVHPLAVAAPFIEAAIGLALLHKATRNAAVIAALAMHAFILLSIGPFGQNSNAVVWPWNLAMAAAVWILFWKSDATVLKYEGWFQIVALLLFAIAPLLSFFGYWDHYLSAAMYSSNRNVAMIYFSDKQFERFPGGVQEYARVETPEIDSIDVNEWSAGELNVPPYPEERVYKNIARHLCEYADVTLSMKSKAMMNSKTITTKSFTCAALKAR